MPVVTCMMPWPQSNDTSVSPDDWYVTEGVAIVIPDSTQARARSSVAGIRRADAVLRFVRVPVSIAGSPKNGSPGNNASTETASMALRYASRVRSAS